MINVWGRYLAAYYDPQVDFSKSTQLKAWNVTRQPEIGSSGKATTFFIKMDRKSPNYKQSVFVINLSFLLNNILVYMLKNRTTLPSFFTMLSLYLCGTFLAQV